MILLIDSSIWLEGLLQQQRAGEVADFLRRVPISRLVISDFALRSIGVVLTRKNQGAAYANFIDQVMIVGQVKVASVATEQLRNLPALCEKLRLDFDDAYQYAVAESANFQLVSFDAHFDHTPRGRLTPAQALAQLQTGKEP